MKNYALFLLTTGLAQLSAQAGVSSYSSQFDKEKDIIKWQSVGEVKALIQHTKNNHDADGGDKKAGDGALLFKTQDNQPGNEVIAYTLRGKMDSRETLTLKISTYNPVKSYYSVEVQIFNKTDDRVLVCKQVTQDGDSKGTVDTVLEYKGTLKDQRDEIQIRLVEKHNNTVRMCAIDSISFQALKK